VPLVVLMRREVREMLRTRAFWLSTALAVALVVAVAVVPPLLRSLGATGPDHVAVLDPTGRLVALLAQAQRAGGQGGSMVVQAWHGTRTALIAAVRAGRLAAGAVVTAGPNGLADARFELVVPTGAAATGDGPVLAALLRAAVVPVRLHALGLSGPALAAALAPVAVSTVGVAAGPFAHASVASVGLVYILIILLFFFVTMYGTSVLTGVSAEKASRVSELLMVTLRAEQLLWAKVLGIGLAGLAQLAIVAAAAGADYLVDPGIVRNGGSVLSGGVPLWAVLPLAVFFVEGYLSYAAVFAAVGASVRQPDEARSAAGLPTVVLMAGYFISLFGLSDPTSPLVTVASFVPMVSPWVMFERLVLGTAPLWQGVVSIAIAAVAIVGVFRWAAAIYRRNLLSTAPFTLWRTRHRRHAGETG